MRFLPSLFLIFVLVPLPCFAWQGTVVKVADGDTLVVQDNDGQRVRIRLYGIDCPEGKQPFGPQATETAGVLAFGASIEVDPIKRDRYNRLVAIVYLPNGSTLEDSLLDAGLAWVFTRYCKRSECEAWRQKEERARTTGIGLWVEPAPVPPWEWRRRR